MRHFFRPAVSRATIDHDRCIENLLPRIDAWPRAIRSAGGGRPAGSKRSEPASISATAEELARSTATRRLRSGRFAARLKRRTRRAQLRANDRPLHAGALAHLTSIENYQRLHWPQSRATFRAAPNSDRARLAEFPLSAPEVTHRRGVRVAAFLDFLLSLFYSVASDAINVSGHRHISRQSAFE